MIPLKIFKNILPSLLIRFIMITDGKHKTSCIDFSRCLFNFFFDSGYLGGGGGRFHLFRDASLRILRCHASECHDLLSTLVYGLQVKD